MQALNLPNALTVGRLALGPVLLLLLLESPASWEAAIALFSAGAATDVLDGHIARRRELITTFGTLLDPVADKVLVGSTLVSLALLDRLAAWVLMVILARELLVSGLRALARREGVVISASPLGKLKMAMQVATVMALIVAADPGALWLQGLIYATVATTVLSGLDYFVKFGGALREGPTPSARTPVVSQPAGGLEP